jgi:hypothetical protein
MDQDVEPQDLLTVGKRTLRERLFKGRLPGEMTNRPRVDANTIKLKPFHFAMIQTFIAIVVGVSSFFFSGASKITSFVVAVENRYATKEALQAESVQRQTDNARIEQMIRDQSGKIDSIYNLLITNGANRSSQRSGH